MNLKKTISIVISGMISLSSIQASFAEGIVADISIMGYEADLDGMVIYTSEPVSTTALADALTVTEAGEAVNVDVTAVAKLTDYGASNISTFNNPNAYKITKANNQKLASDVIYNVAVNNWEKKFKIETIISDDFSDGTTNKWKWNHTKISNSSTMAVENGALRVTAQHGAGSYGLIYSELVPQNYETLAERNLGGTVEFDIRKVSGDTGYAFYYGFVPTQTDLSSKDHGLSMIVIEPDKDSIRALLTKGKADWEEGSSLIFMEPGTFCGNDMMNIKYVFVGDHYVTYVNDKKIIDATTTDITSTGALAFAFNIEGVVYEMDNIVWTRVLECVTGMVNKEEYDLNEDVIITLSDSFLQKDFSKDWLTVTDEKDNPLEFNAEPVSDTEIVLSIAEGQLQYGENYKIKFNDNFEIASGADFFAEDIIFKTIPPAFDLSSFKYENGEVFAKLENYREDTPVNCFATVVLYDNKNTTIAVSGGKFEISKGQSVNITTEEIQDIIMTKAVKAKCMVWTNLIDMETIFDKDINLD